MPRRFNPGVHIDLERRALQQSEALNMRIAIISSRIGLYLCFRRLFPHLSEVSLRLQKRFSFAERKTT